MALIEYRVVEHDGGWAYKLGDVFSETYRSREAARHAANIAAREQQAPGDDVGIVYEDENGVWHSEVSDGGDRPITSVAD
jgi:hypothetical protein